MKNANRKRRVRLFTGWAALIATALFIGLFTGCPQNPKSKSKFKVNFSVDGWNGKLTASVDDKGINSGYEVEEGKTVVFKATPDKNYTVKAWTLDGTTENKKETVYSLTVSKDVSVKVSFEKLDYLAILDINPKEKTIFVTVKTSDYSAVTVKGAGSVTSVPHNVKTELTAEASQIILKNSRIRELECQDNKLTYLDVRGLIDLEKLSCQGNKLTGLEVKGLAKLTDLNCEGNELTGLDVKGLTKLKTLYCQVNKLTSLNVEGLIELTNLNCYNNKLTSLKVHNLVNLEELYCSENKIEDLSIKSLNNLKQLSCNDNNLKEDTFTALLDALPPRISTDEASCTLYSEKDEEGNYKFNSPSAALIAAFNKAKGNNWALQKQGTAVLPEDITLP